MEDVTGNAELLSGQAVQNPASIFLQHIFARVQLGQSLILFDPSYGITYYSGKAGQNVNVDLRFAHGFFQGKALAGLAKSSFAKQGNNSVWTFLVQKLEKATVQILALGETYK